jgi:hypothetical protein
MAAATKGVLMSENGNGSGVVVAADAAAALVQETDSRSLFSEPQEDRSKIPTPKRVSREVKLLEHEHERLKKAARRLGKPMTIVLRDMLNRGLWVQEQLDDGYEVAVLRNGRVLYKVV